MATLLEMVKNSSSFFRSCLRVVFFFAIRPSFSKAYELMRQFQNAPFGPISAAGSNFNPRNIQHIPVVKIFAFLDLGQN